MSSRDSDATPRSQPTRRLSRDAPPPLGAVIRVTGARATPAELRLADGDCVIGAGADADIIVDDRAVSRRHAELELCADGVAVRDLGSRNGIFYLGQRIERAVLSFGARLQIGTAEVAIDLDTSTLESMEHNRPVYRGLVGLSAAMGRLFSILARLEGATVPVLVEGESGVGKELVARAIHQGSALAAGALVAINCGAIRRELVQSELFGHKKGAFTGASEDRRGAFDAADGGTLFLDEIGELPLEVQPALLRTLELGEVKPLGSDSTHQVRTRIVAATNRDLAADVEAGRFREDLYFRLAVVRVRVPALRERPEDIPVLAAEMARQAGAGELPKEVIQQLSQRDYKGNVRELRNAVLAYLAIGVLPDATRQDGLLELALRQAVDTSDPFAEQRDKLLDLFTRVYLEQLLREAGNLTEAARRCGLERSYLGKLARKHGVRT